MFRIVTRRVIHTLGWAFVSSALAQDFGFGPGGRGSRHDIAVETEYGASSDLRFRNGSRGDMEVLHTSLAYTHHLPSTGSIRFRAGIDWDRFGFELPSELPIPGELNSFALPVGFDWTPAEKWSVRLQLNPGFFGDGYDVSGDDLNLPGTFGISYSPNRSIVWLLQFAIDPRRDIPVVGGIGVIWRFHEKATLLLTLPRPRFEYRRDESLSFYLGGSLQGGAFRVDSDRPLTFGNERYDGEWITYREIRAGAGMRWTLSRNWRTELESGWVVDRRFVYNDLRRQFNGDGAFYVALRLHGTF